MRKFCALFLCLMACMAIPASADNAVRVPTMTRLVAEFQAKEQDLIAAMKAGSREQLAQLVEPGFQLEPAVLGGADFVPFDNWVDTSLKQAPAYSDRPLNMAVRDFGEVAAVTFEWNVLPSPSAKIYQRYHVTDLWRRRDGDQGAG